MCVVAGCGMAISGGYDTRGVTGGLIGDFGKGIVKRDCILRNQAGTHAMKRALCHFIEITIFFRA